MSFHGNRLWRRGVCAIRHKLDADGNALFALGSASPNEEGKRRVRGRSDGANRVALCTRFEGASLVAALDLPVPECTRGTRGRLVFAPAHSTTTMS
jgi:hypothetical protein